MLLSSTWLQPPALLHQNWLTSSSQRDWAVAPTLQSTKPTERWYCGAVKGKHQRSLKMSHTIIVSSVWFLFKLKVKAEDYDCDTAGRQQRGGGGEGGCEKESKQGIHRKLAHRDWNAQDHSSPSYSPAKRLPGKLIYSFWICGSSAWLLVFPWVSECLSFISGMLRIFIWSWSGVLVEICPASSAAAGFCLSGWPDASCNR